MGIKFDRDQTFATNDTVTAAKLHNLVDGLDIYQALITDQTEITSISTSDKLLIADADLTASDAPRSVKVHELFDDALTGGTFTNAQLTGSLSYGTATGNRTVSTSATITTGTIPTLVSNNATFTNATATGANITNGTVQTLTSSTATITSGTFGGLLNNSTGTFSGSVNSTLGTIGTLNSTTGTIGNLSTTLAGDLTISQGTATLATSGVTVGTYGTTGVIPRIAVDSKGRVTSLGTAIGGKVLQVVESTSTANTSIASTSFTDTGLSASITPNYSTSKILVYLYHNIYLYRQSTTQTAFSQVIRTIGTTSSTVYGENSGSDSYISVGGATTIQLITKNVIQFVDTPNTTSQCTYKTQSAANNTANSGRIEINNGNGVSKMFLIEVAA